MFHFTTTKQFNRKQIKLSELLRQYKFKIQYTSEKKNERTNALSKKSDHMQKKKITNHNMLKINQNGTLSANTKKLNATLRILKNSKK